MLELLSIKHLTHFMVSGKIRLSRQDAGFLNNISQLITAKGKITSNQVKLFNHVVRKYDRQFAKLGYDVNKLVALPWNLPIVESSAHYTDAFIELVDDRIFFRCPYNNKFLKQLRESADNDCIVWDRVVKQYEAKFSTTILKMVVNMVFNHYETVHCCDKIIAMMDSLLQYDKIKYWNPTLVNVKGNYLIAATNEAINQLVEKITLSDDPYILNYLCKHAINIDEDILKTPIQQFAASYTPQIDYEHIEQLIEYLKEIKCDSIYIEQRNSEDKNWSNLKTLLTQTKIPIVETSIWTKPPSPKERGYVNPVIISGLASNMFSGYFSVSKVISLVNNKPIKLK